MFDDFRDPISALVSQKSNHTSDAVKFFLVKIVKARVFVVTLVSTKT